MIVDSGASDHMTGDKSLLTDFLPCNENHLVKIADGSISKVAGFGSVTISKTLSLHFVLLVPNLDYNLLSISKLTRDKNCVAKFFQNMC